MEPEAQALTFADLTTAMSGTDSEFWNQFAGSSTANGFVILLIALAAGLRKLCNRNSKCKSHLHCCCLDVDIKDQTLRERPDNLDEGQGGTV